MEGAMGITYTVISLINLADCMSVGSGLWMTNLRKNLVACIESTHLHYIGVVKVAMTALETVYHGSFMCVSAHVTAKL